MDPGIVIVHVGYYAARRNNALFMCCKTCLCHGFARCVSVLARERQVLDNGVSL
jgi:hypothetical protein